VNGPGENVPPHHAAIGHKPRTIPETTIAHRNQRHPNPVVAKLVANAAVAKPISSIKTIKEMKPSSNNQKIKE
jgi:hypothetical protein